MINRSAFLDVLHDVSAMEKLRWPEMLMLTSAKYHTVEALGAFSHSARTARAQRQLLRCLPR